MSWSWKLGRVAGIGIYVHATFLLLLFWVAFVDFSEGGSLGAIAGAVIFTLAVFGTIVLHELGHALVARRFGIRTRDITLLPIGGVARLDRIPEIPRQELLVAIAGPAVNVAIAATIFVALELAGAAVSPGSAGVADVPFLPKLMWVNVGIVIFNLIPAFPMDGGRVLRALLAMRMDYVTATQAAAGVGRTIALLFGLAGLLVNPFLVLIAVFVWFTAGQEAAQVRLRAALRGVRARRAMITSFETLESGDPLDRAADHLVAGFQHDFPVVDDGRLVGILTREDLVKALARRPPVALVAEAMRREFQTADPDEMLAQVFDRLETDGCRSFPVVRDGRLLGVITLENVGELLLVESALRAAPA